MTTNMQDGRLMSKRHPYRSLQEAIWMDSELRNILHQRGWAEEFRDEFINDHRIDFYSRQYEATNMLVLMHLALDELRLKETFLRWKKQRDWNKQADKLTRIVEK